MLGDGEKKFYSVSATGRRISGRIRPKSDPFNDSDHRNTRIAIRSAAIRRLKPVFKSGGNP